MKLKHTLTALVAAAAMWSCSTPKDVTYLQDLTQSTYVPSASAPTAIKAAPDDKITIIVHSKDPELAALFNMPVQSKRLGITSKTIDSSANSMTVYTVDAQGCIDFPVLGEIHVAGMTRSEIAKDIKNRIIRDNLIKDPTVTVEFANAGISVLGEVARPGRYDMSSDRVTLLEGLALAGDLTIQGERSNVTVIRENTDGSTNVYKVDLTSAESLYGSPAYYLQQNDVIYVDPNSFKKRQRQASGNTVLTPSFWLSAASLLTTIAVLIFK